MKITRQSFETLSKMQQDFLKNMPFEKFYGKFDKTEGWEPTKKEKTAKELLSMGFLEKRTITIVYSGKAAKDVLEENRLSTKAHAIMLQIYQEQDYISRSLRQIEWEKKTRGVPLSIKAIGGAAVDYWLEYKRRPTKKELNRYISDMAGWCG